MEQYSKREPIVLGAEQRRATYDALRIGTSARADRPGLRAVMVDGGRAIVTDTYCAVLIPTLAGLPEGAWDADILADACKGAGTDALRIAPVDGADLLEVQRFRPSVASRLQDTYGDGVPDALVVATYRAGTVDGAPRSVHQIITDALADVDAPDYLPEPAAFSPTLLATVLGARPSSRAKGNPAPVRIHMRGNRAAVLAEGGKPFAVIMPMREG